MGNLQGNLLRAYCGSYCVAYSGVDVMTDIDKDREEFEAWYVTHYFHRFDLSVAHMEESYASWQACRAHYIPDGHIVVQGMQPISTAPVRVDILCWAEDLGFYVGRVYPNHPPDEPQPTLWMPLPPPLIAGTKP